MMKQIQEASTTDSLVSMLSVCWWYLVALRRVVVYVIKVSFSIKPSDKSGVATARILIQYR